MNLRNLKFPHYLLLTYLILFIVCAINPYDRSVWWAENIPIMLIVLSFVLTYRKFQFSNTAYVLMSIFIFMHTIGGHYTFSRVPFDFITNLFGFSRNHYDRFAHFAVGFYAYGMCEFLLLKKIVTKKWALFAFPIFFIMALAATYELFEWIFAISADPAAGMEVLGSQGDIWDAQKDILMDTLGAITSLVLFYFVRKNDIKKIK